MPVGTLGKTYGPSMLFPMEELFEKYVGKHLRASLPRSASLRMQSSSEHLCAHVGKPRFLLKPDFVIDEGDRRWVLDTKWKLLDSTKVNENYLLAQSDLYQLFAYGQKYLRGVGDLCLVFPRTLQFDQPLPRFDFSSSMRLWVVPFDLEDNRLLLPEGFQWWWSELSRRRGSN